MPIEELSVDFESVVATVMRLSMVMSTVATRPFLPREDEIFEGEDAAADTADDEVGVGNIDADHDDNSGNGAGAGAGGRVDDGGDGDAWAMNSKQQDDGGMDFECFVFLFCVSNHGDSSLSLQHFQTTATP